jgi:O-antigen/teichoic acid export membrane protein
VNYLRGLSVTALATGLTFCLGFANQALLARLLGTEGRGHLALVATSVLLGGLLFGEWLSRGNAYHAGRQPQRVGSIWKNTTWYCLALLAGTVGITVIVAGTSLVPWGWPFTPVQLTLATALITVLVAQRGYNAILLGSDRLAPYALIPLLFITCYLVFNALALSWLEFGLTTVLIAWLAAATLAMSVAAAFAASPGAVDGGLLRSTSCVGGRGAVSATLIFLLFRSDIYLVEHFLDAPALGVYAIAIVLAEMIQRGPNVAGAVLLPKVLRGADDDHATSLVVGRWTLLFSLLVAGMVIVAGRPLIYWCFGDDYIGAYGPLVWMLPGLVAAGFASILNTKLAGQGYPPVTLWGPAVALTVNVALNLVLIPRAGLIGAAQATSVAYILWALIVTIAYQRHTGSGWRQLLPG